MAKRKESPAEYAKHLRQNLSLYKAKAVAKRCKDATAPSAVADYPVGSVFFEKSYNSNNWSMNAKRYTQLHSFWTQVSAILQKQKE